jgi:hypothetical protein
MFSFVRTIRSPFKKSISIRKTPSPDPREDNDNGKEGFVSADKEGGSSVSEVSACGEDEEIRSSDGDNVPEKRRYDMDCID